MTKTKAAFLLTAQRLFNNSDEVYFWTFTLKRVYPDDWVMKFWNDFRLALCKRMPLLAGIRVVEIHPGGHGLHFHALVNQRIPMWFVRRLGWKYGFGKAWVERCDIGAATYLTKYLTKEDELAPGARRWGTIGGFKQTRVRDIEVESPLTLNMAKMYKMVSQQAFHGGSLRNIPALQVDYSSFQEIGYLTKLFGDIDQWPGKCFHLTVSTDKRSEGRECRVMWENEIIRAMLPGQKGLADVKYRAKQAAEYAWLRSETAMEPGPTLHSFMAEAVSNAHELSLDEIPKYSFLENSNTVLLSNPRKENTASITTREA